MEYERKSDTNNNRGDWNDFKALGQYLSNIPGKHEIKEMQKKKKNSHTGHCTHTMGRNNVKVQNIFHWRNSITYGTNCKCGTGAILYTPETLIISGF